MAIIGINGRISSGKDLVGNIIQYLSSPLDISKTSFRDFIKYYGQKRGFESSWEIKKFAYKLKQIASILTGIPIEKFEEQEFKKTYLGDEWSNQYGDRMSVRELLQRLGTNCVRDNLHQNTWVNALFADYKVHIDGYPALVKSDGQDLIEGQKYSMGEAVYPNWCITDVRFPNEAQAIKDRGGIIVRINRGEQSEENLHISETALDNWDFDFIINNDSSIEDLIKKVKDTIGDYIFKN